MSTLQIQTKTKRIPKLVTEQGKAMSEATKLVPVTENVYETRQELGDFAFDAGFSGILSLLPIGLASYLAAAYHLMAQPGGIFFFIGCQPDGINFQRAAPDWSIGSTQIPHA